MSFDLDVLAAHRDADDDLVRAMALRCRSDPHPDSDLDERIVRFYEALRGRYPDQPPFGEATPWAVAPLDVGIDHVTMALRHGPHGDAVIQLVIDLAAVNGLTIYDPQGDTVTRPDQPDRPRNRQRTDLPPIGRSLRPGRCDLKCPQSMVYRWLDLSAVGSRLGWASYALQTERGHLIGSGGLSVQRPARRRQRPSRAAPR